MTIRLRKATPDDLDTLRRWDREPHVIEATGGDDWQWATELQREPPWREMLIAELDGLPIGFLEIIDPHAEESRYWGKVPPNLRAMDIWIGERDALNRGHGSEMMRIAIDRCFADESVDAIVIDPLASNTAAHRFYERLGFRFVGRRTFGDDECFVFRLERGDWR